MWQKYAEITELYILWSELSWRNLSPTLTTANYSCRDNSIGLVAQYEISGYVWASFWRQLDGNFYADLAPLPQLE